MNSVVGIRLFFGFSFWVLVPYVLFVVYQREVDIFYPYTTRALFIREKMKDII